MLMDNGPPWGDSGGGPYTAFTIWLMHHGIHVSHGRTYHPQTQGKIERFHRSLKAEVLDHNSYADLPACQNAFDRWHHIYNHKRPHDALGHNPPANRYRPSPRLFDETLPPIAYGPSDSVRKVDIGGEISFKNSQINIGKAFRKQPLALRPTSSDGLFDVHYCKSPTHRAAQPKKQRGKNARSCGHRKSDDHNPTGSTTTTRRQKCFLNRTRKV